MTGDVAAGLSQLFKQVAVIQRQNRDQGRPPQILAELLTCRWDYRGRGGCVPQGNRSSCRPAGWSGASPELTCSLPFIAESLFKCTIKASQLFRTNACHKPNFHPWKLAAVSSPPTQSDSSCQRFASIAQRRCESRLCFDFSLKLSLCSSLDFSRCHFLWRLQRLNPSREWRWHALLRCSPLKYTSQSFCVETVHCLNACFYQEQTSAVHSFFLLLQLHPSLTHLLLTFQAAQAQKEDENLKYLLRRRESRVLNIKWRKKMRNFKNIPVWDVAGPLRPVLIIHVMGRWWWLIMLI